MSVDAAVNEKLAAFLLALWEEDAGETLDGVDGVSESIDAYLGRLLPVVREIAAEELREAAEEVRDNHGTASLSAKRITARADALTKPPDGPVR